MEKSNPDNLNRCAATNAESMQNSRPVLFKRVLLATDFSEASRNALHYAAAIACHYGARLYLFHVASSINYELQQQAVQLAARDLGEIDATLAADCARSGTESEIVLREGRVWEESERLIKENDIDLIVLGTQGRTGLKKIVLGSVAEEVFRKVSCPALTVGPTSKKDWLLKKLGPEKTVLYATDFGDASMKALPYAVSIANRSNSKLVILHATGQLTGPEFHPYIHNQINLIENDIRETAIRRMEKMMSTQAPCRTEFKVVVALPADGILGGAAESAAGLIVLGLNKSLFIGHHPWATAYEVVIRAMCPVLTVRNLES